MGEIINEQDKERARAELKKSKKYCWVGGITGMISLFCLLKFSGIPWLSSLAVPFFILGTFIYDREMRIIGYIKGYNDGYTAAKSEKAWFMMDIDSVGHWNKVEI